MSLLNLTEPIKLARAAADTGWKGRTVQVVGDIHVGWTPQQRLDDAAADLLASDGKAALRVFIGDVTEDVANSTQDTAALALMRSSSPSGWRSVIGNHDRQQSSSPTWETVFGQTRNWYEDIGTDVRVIGVSPDTGGTDPITLTSGTLSWLDARLAETTRQCLICCHAPLQNTVMGGYFNSDTTFFSAQPNAGIRTVLDAHSNVRAWISGHTHTPISSASLISRVVMPAGHTIVAVNVGAVAYTGAVGTGKPVNPNDALPDPNFTCYVTCWDDRLEVRYRDSLTHNWRTWQSNLLTTEVKDATTSAQSGPALSLAQPTLFLSPATSRDTGGTITPTTVGTVSTTAGIYGTAWDCTSGGVWVPLGSRVSNTRGSLLVRLRLNYVDGTRRVIADIGNTSAGHELVQMRYEGTSPYTTLLALDFDAGVENARATVTSPYGSSHSDLLTYMMRWDEDTIDVTVGTTQNQASGIRGANAAFTTSDNIWIGLDRSTTSYSRALIESVLIYDDWITDDEFTAISERPAAWTWDMLPTQAALPAAATGPTYSYAMPLLHLTVAASKDTEGAVTPTTSGTVSTVSGTYGQGWDLTSGQITVPLVLTGQRARSDHGTILVRATLGATTADTRCLFDIGDTTDANYGLFQARYSQVNPSQMTLFWFVGGTQDASVTVTSPYGSTHASIVTYMARWDGSIVALGIGSSANVQSTQRTTVKPFQATTKKLTLGSARGLTSAQWTGRVEDVLIVNRAITNGEFDTAAAWPTTWPWRLFG